MATPISGTNAPLLSKIPLIQLRVNMYRISKVASTLSRSLSDSSSIPYLQGELL